MPETIDPNGKRMSLRRLLLTGMGVRLVVDTVVQSFFSFLPIFALGLGLTIAEMGRLNSVRSLAGLAAPFIGAWAERNGYRRALWLSLVAVVIGLAVLTQGNSYWLTAVAMFAIGAGLGSFTPNLSAYISAQVPYAQRARSFGFLEISWGLASVVGVSILGIAIEAYGWRTPMMILGGMLLVGAAIIARLPPTDRDAREQKADTVTTHPPQKLSARIGNYFDFGRDYVSAWGTLLCGTVIIGTVFHFLGTYAAWLFDEYELGAAGLGRVAFALGIAALASNVLTGVFGDRYGSKRSMQVGTFVGAIAFFSIPFLNNMSLNWVIAAVWVGYLFFELAIVNSFVVLSEQVPSARAKLMTLGAAFGTLGISVANMSGPWAYSRFGVQGLAWPAGVGLTIAFILLMTIVREQPLGDNNG